MKGMWEFLCKVWIDVIEGGVVVLCFIEEKCIECLVL